ncbi:MAG TPA: DNA topoisomerase IB [Candidatus Dormibacteraeota bacterium]|nr:DNA topoisomerase IB [Candidatus Dormibacteraeota bacterium]
MEAAADAGLRWTGDDEPGIRREPVRDAMRYVRSDGSVVDDEATLARIRRLAIPPAWTAVRICADPDGHIQATGRDSRGRKQYRYHPRWRSVRDEAKFERTLSFARRLPRIRARVERDLAVPGLPRDKVLALVVRLLEVTLVRVGNDEYAKANRSFGLTTLRDRHATIGGAGVRFRFRGKAGKTHEIGLRDRRLARLVRRCQELPGQELFQYVDDDGSVRDVASDDVNEYLRRISGESFTAKDFRTWEATVLAYRAFGALDLGRSASAAKRDLNSAIGLVAERLGNTPAVCRRSYVHPGVVDAYLEGSSGRAMLEAAEDATEPPETPTRDEELAVIRLLERQLRRRRRSERAPAGTAAVGGATRRRSGSRRRQVTGRNEADTRPRRPTSGGRREAG